jgi:hypothetical protein
MKKLILALALLVLFATFIGFELSAPASLSHAPVVLESISTNTEDSAPSTDMTSESPTDASDHTQAEVAQAAAPKSTTTPLHRSPSETPKPSPPSTQPSLPLPSGTPFIFAYRSDTLHDEETVSKKDIAHIKRAAANRVATIPRPTIVLNADAKQENGVPYVLYIAPHLDITPSPRKPQEVTQSSENE